MNSSRFHRFLLATCLALLPAIAAAHPDPTPTPTPTPSPPLTGSLTLKTRTDTGQDGAGGTAAVLPPVPADLTRITIGTEINIAATPGSDFVFVRWESEPSGQVANSGKSQTSTYISGDLTITAIFRQKTWKLDLAVSPNLGAPLPAGSGYLPKNAQHTISVTPNAGYEFVEWRVDKGNVTVLGAGSTTDIKLGEPQDSQWNLTAIVKRIDPSINVLTLEADTGGSARAQLGFTMLTVPAGTSAEKAFTLGEGITLWATPSANYSFAGWEGPVAGTGAVASISLSGPTHVRAKFSPVPFNVSIARANANGGAEVGGSSVSGGNGTPGLDISVPTPGPDNANYPMGSVVTLTASPAGDYLFRKWQATQLGIPVTLPDNDVNPYSFTVGNRPLVITALFARLADIPLTLHADAGGSATATGTFSNPLNGNPLTVTVNAIENGSATGYYLENTPVTITANPSANFAFDKWTGDVSNAQAGSSPLSMTMSSAKTVTAGFKRVRSDLTVAISPAAAATAGARVINAAFPFANLTGVTNHPVNTTLSIRPVNATTTEAAWVFDHWEGDLSGTANPASISLPTDRTIIAVFRQQHVLTLKTNPAWKGSITVSTGTLSLDSSTGNNIWTGIYAEGTSVTITVIPYNSVAFSSWTGDTADIPPAQLAVNPLTITMDRSRTLIATITAATQIGLGVTPDYRETLTQTMSLPNTEADKIRISGNFSITAGNPAESKVFGYICAIPDNWPQTTNTAYVSKNDTISLSAPELVTDNNGVVWQFTAWGIGYWHPEPQSWGRNHTLNVADLGNDSPIPIRALYTDQRVLRPTVTLDGATTTAVSIKANSAVLTTGSEKKYTWNQTAALEAYSQTGVVFSSWGGEAQPDASDRTLAATTMNVDRSNVIASYKTAIPVTLDIVVEGGSAARPQFAPWLTATLPGEGTVPVGAYLPQTFQVGKGDTITFAVTDTIVTPVAGRYRFKGWDTDADGVVDQTGSSLSRVADAACTVKAVFVRTWTLETLVDPAVAGSITSTPSAAWYDHGTSVILTANNGTGYVFHHWSETSPGSFTGGYQDGATATDQITHITMVANQSLTAHYEFARNALSVNINVNGTLNPPAHTDNLPFTADGTPLTAPGSKMYNYGVNANITATVPAPGAAYRFDGWNPPASKGTNNPITVEMLGAQAITAHYKTRCLIAFSVETVGGGTGGAPSVTGHTAMDGNSWVSYYGDTVTLAANPASGYRFLRWEIDTDGDPATIEITDTRSPWSSAITTNWQVKAVYAKEYTLTFATNPADGSGGTVNKPASYIAYHGEKITNVIASPKIDYDWYFTKWTVSPDAMDLTEPVPSGIHDTDTNPVSFTVTDNHVITANFSRAGQERTLTLTIRLDGVDNPPGCLLTVLADGSSVAGHIDPTRIPAGGTKLYYRGDQPRLDATPANAAGDSLAADYEFVGWGDSASANPVRTLSAVLGDTPVTAIYRTKAVLYMQVQPPGVATTTPVPPDGTPYATWLGENITITATPTAEHIDDYAFEKWTALPVASPPNPVNHYNSVININARERTAIAHFKPGCRLEVKAQYETTPHPADPQTYGIATGTRTTAAAGAGNTAAIRSPYSGEPDSAIKTIIIDEGTGKASARIIATAASPTFRFVRWDIDDNNDGVIDRTLSASSGDIVMDSTIGRNVVAYAIFEKNTVTLTVHTSPDGIPETVDGTANTASTGSPINITAEPKIYRYFYGDTANLQAIDNSDGVYTFGGWYRGEGYSELAENLISSNLATSYGPLKSDAVVTAVFWVGGKYRIILFLDQTSEGRKVDIKNLSALGTFTLTYMKIDGRNACVVGFTDGLSSGALTPSAEAWVHRSDTNNNAAAAATTAAAATSLPPPPSPAGHRTTTCGKPDPCQLMRPPRLLSPFAPPSR
jgi:hypothetical protein